MPVPALERFHHHLGVERRHALHVDDARLQKNIGLHAEPFSAYGLTRQNQSVDRLTRDRRALLPSIAVWSDRRSLFAIQLYDQALVDVLTELRPIGRTLERARHLFRIDFDPRREADFL